MPPTLFFLSLFSLLFLDGSFGADPAVLLTSNATTIEVGVESFQLKCQLENYSPGNELYWVDFLQGNTIFCQYFITAPDSTGHRTITFDNETYNHPSLGRHPLSSTFPVYEITVTPTVAGTKEYWCNLYHRGLVDVDSNHLSLTVTPPSPRAVLTSNVTSPLPRQPFTVTCTFTGFTPLPVDYSVIFNSLQDGQLAVFEVANGKALLNDVIQERLQVSPSARATYPTFEVILTQKEDNSSSSAYWCALQETGKTPVQSNTWPLLVTFTGSKSAEGQRTGTCAVGATSLDLKGKPYSVQFWSDRGPKSVNLLAEYNFASKLPEEFKSHPLAPWTSIHHGLNTSWPVFSVVANGTGSQHGAWWCELSIGAQGSPDYREFKSNRVDL